MWMYRGALQECVKANTNVLRQENVFVCLRKSQEPSGIEEMGSTVLGDQVREETAQEQKLWGTAWHVSTLLFALNEMKGHLSRGMRYVTQSLIGSLWAMCEEQTLREQGGCKETKRDDSGLCQNGKYTCVEK